MQRQQVLYQPAKQVQVVMLEGALRALVVSAPTLVGQLDRLLARHWTADPRARHHPV